MTGLAVSINNIFLLLVYIFVYIPLLLLFWFSIGTVLSFLMGPLGYVVALIGMVYYWKNSD